MCEDIPEVLEGCVDVEAPAVHVLNIGCSQLHFSNSKAPFIILGKNKARRGMEINL